MALKPVLKVKVDELFMRWVTEPTTQVALRNGLQQILRGEPVSVNSPINNNYSSSRLTSKPQSPRPKSPSTPPCSPSAAKLVNTPLSPRRPSSKSGSKPNQETIKSTDKEHVSSPVDTVKPGRTKEGNNVLKFERVGDKRVTTELKQDNVAPVIETPIAVPKKQSVTLQLQQPRSPVNIPPFYFPLGQPFPSKDAELINQRIKDVFSKLPENKATLSQTADVALACGVPVYWKAPLFFYAGGQLGGTVTLTSFLAAWKKLTSHCHDEAARFVHLLTKGTKNHLVADDFEPLVQDIVDTHPGLSFLQEASEFHSRYVMTVIARIFFSVNRSWSGKITIAELRRSNFLQTLRLLSEEEDINQIRDFFSYEHFYVIYCKFWELDKDHDLFISKEDLARHNDHAISSRMIDRIFSGVVSRTVSEGRMAYRDFVWFILAEEDKRNPTSIEYWFRCMDLDGDGYISMYEMQYFYEEQVQKMEAFGIETLPFNDCLCQMLDMVEPATKGKVSLRDLKNCKLTHIFFDTFFNLDKYLEHEQRDPFASLRDSDGEEARLTDWDRYAADEYERLLREEGANEMPQDDVSYEDDFEPEDEEEVLLESANNGSHPRRPKAPGPEDDLVIEQLTKSPSKENSKGSNSQTKDKSSVKESQKLNANKEPVKVAVK